MTREWLGNTDKGVKQNRQEPQDEAQSMGQRKETQTGSYWLRMLTVNKKGAATTSSMVMVSPWKKGPARRKEKSSKTERHLL